MIKVALIMMVAPFVVFAVAMLAAGIIDAFDDGWKQGSFALGLVLWFGVAFMLLAAS